MVINAGASVGRPETINTGAAIIQGLKIGNNSIIGAGSVVLRDIEPYEKAIGIMGS